MPHPPAKPARKPRDPKGLVTIEQYAEPGEYPRYWVAADCGWLSSSEARHAAAKIMEFADWIDAQAQRPRGKGRGR